MLCNKCKKEIENDSKICGYCGNTIENKKNINKKIIMLTLIFILVIVALITIPLVINLNNKNKTEKSKTLYSLSELEFLKQVNTNELFTTLNRDVNNELNGTYAILTTQNLFEDTYNIIALKKDNTMVKIATTKYSDWDNGILNLFYSNGKIYYEYADETIWSIDLTEGNGNYNLKQYDFLEGYIYDNAWFYIINNKIYYFNSGSLHICDMSTEECEMQIIDNKQSFISFEIDSNEIDISFENVYMEEDKYIYVLTKDKEKIYKIDIKNPILEKDPWGDDAFDLLYAKYTEVEKISETAKQPIRTSILSFEDIIFDYEYNGKFNFFIKYKNKKYELKNHNYRPITLLPNNYLVVEHYSDEKSDIGEIEYINLKTGLVDKNYSLEFEDNYNEELYFITKK